MAWQDSYTSGVLVLTKLVDNLIVGLWSFLLKKKNDTWGLNFPFDAFKV